MAVVVTVCLLDGLIAALIASVRRRSAPAWFVCGALIPVAGLIALVILPSPALDAAAVSSVMPEHRRDMIETTVAQRTHLESATLAGIARLVELRDRGALTPYEFAEKRAELLARVRSPTRGPLART